jgi:hypothetical protein
MERDFQPLRRRETGRSRRAMTLSGTVVLAAVLGLGLMVAGLASSWVRNELKVQATREMLVRLDEALWAYQRATGHWPAETLPASQPAGPRHTARQEADLGGSTSKDLRSSADQILAALGSVPGSRAVLEQIPEDNRVESSIDAPAGTGGAPFSLVDEWRHHLGCLTADSFADRDRRAVAANGGRPIFISPGPDGLFGDESMGSAADDIFLQPAPRPGSRPGP